MSQASNAPAKLIARFWSKVKRGGPGECWPWLACKTPLGYGKFSTATSTWTGAHRQAFVLLRGPIPPGLTIDHLCRNPACVNPAHMEVVTSVENTMRGFSPMAIQARMVVCAKGHAIDGRKRNGERYCRTCRRERRKARYWERRASGLSPEEART